MTRFAIRICAAALCLVTVGAMSPLDYGVAMNTKALQGMCWYEYLKKMPESPYTGTDNFGNCYLNSNVADLQKQFADQGVSGDDAKPYIGQFMHQRTMQFLPAASGYSACEEYSKDADKAPEQTFSELLRDGDTAYPYRGYAHCVIGQLQKTYGQPAMSAMDEKWKYRSLPWLKVVNDRENENRARHGAKPLKLNKELTDRAQRWADKLAKKCSQLQLTDHIQPGNPDYKYKNEPTGESISQSSSQLISEDNALTAADGWYEEVKDYPWPAYTGNGYDSQFGKIGHFTAQVWKGSEYVGYGLGRRDGCDKVYVVGRYWPGGNVVGVPDSFKNNIGALQS